MPRKQHTYHYIYKTTCNVNGKYYIGMHSTSNLEDGYLGSGKRLWLSIKKHGRENHSIEILEWLPDRSSLKLREREIVNEDFLKDTRCMNLALGGEGGFGSVFLSKDQLSLGGKNSMKVIWSNLEFRENHRNTMRSVMKSYLESGKIKKYDWTGKSHKEETKKKIGLANSITQAGEKNSQFGTCWIYHLSKKKSMKIEIENIETYIKEGWLKGRKLNF